MPDAIPVVVLAGGLGSRMGGCKPQRRLAGESLLGRAVDTARQWSPAVRVAVRDRSQASGVEAELIFDDPTIPGPLAGVAAALAWAGGEGAEHVLTIPCDMPFLPPDLLFRLDEVMGPAHGAAVAASGMRLHPVCTLWRTPIAPLLVDQVRLGRLSLMALTARAGRVVADWPTDPVDPFLNLNSPEDLAGARALLAESRP